MKRWALLWMLCGSWLLVVSPAARAEDWPQWMGPSRDDVWRAEGVVEKFPAGGPKILWRAKIGAGYAGPAVVGDRVYVTDFVSEQELGENNPGARAEMTGQERLLCLNANTGEVVWQQEAPCKYNISYASGPRATPTVVAGKVYSLGAEGRLACYDAASGKPIWSVELTRRYQVQTPNWGFCSHPLIDGDLLYTLAGGEDSLLVALNKETGDEVWHALPGKEIGYAPATMVKAGGVNQLIQFTPEGVTSLDPRTGKTFWTIEIKPNYSMSVCAPQQSADHLFVSAIGDVAALFKLTADHPGAEEVWRAEKKSGVFCCNSSPIIDGETIYGNDCQTGHLRAVKLQTGERLWETLKPVIGDGEEKRVNHGTVFLTRNADRYFLFNELGDLIIAKLSPQEYQEISRAHILEPTNEAFGRKVVWSHPAYANRRAYLRNDQEIVCVDLAK
jgi:outer membrane protein assembly factor BamB